MRPWPSACCGPRWCSGPGWWADSSCSCHRPPGFLCNSRPPAISGGRERRARKALEVLKKRGADENSFFPPGTDGDHLHRHTDELFDALDIAAGVGRQGVQTAQVGEPLGPPGQVFIHRRELFEDLDAGRHFVVVPPLMLIAGTDPQRRQTTQHIDLSE